MQNFREIGPLGSILLHSPCFKILTLRPPFHFRTVLFYKRKSCFCLTVLYYPMRSDLVQPNLVKQKEIYRSTSQFLLTTVRQTNFEIVLLVILHSYNHWCCNCKAASLHFERQTPNNLGALPWPIILGQNFYAQCRELNLKLDNCTKLSSNNNTNVCIVTLQYLQLLLLLMELILVDTIIVVVMLKWTVKCRLRWFLLKK